MFFSVLIPVYNVEKYLNECIESVLSQNEKDFEIVLIDDGSTDSSGKICDIYTEKFPNIVRVVHKENEGLLLARRRAIKEARGEYFVHLDSDDYLLPNALSDVRKALEETDSDMAIFKIVYGQDSKDKEEFVSKLPFTDRQVFEGSSKSLLYRQLMLGGYMTAIFQKIAHRSIVDISDDYEQFRGIVSLSEDHLQSLPLLANSKRAVFLDTAYVYYRYNSNSITKKVTLNSIFKDFMSLRTIYESEIEYYSKYKLTEEETSFVYAKHANFIFQKLVQGINLIDSKEKRVEYYKFLKQVSNDNYIKLMLRSANVNKIARVNRMGYKLLMKNQFKRYEFFMKHIVNHSGFLKRIGV